ncbi:glutathione S-transferase family protein [Zavarzinia sp. CC-PAN008]|uniref:glutathione S-transferase family protein n=1 Tax=Zavarzinia sp. CC-PAN008 TaxID=3243332 RepID=UPI003F742876
MLFLFDHPVSSYAQKVRIALREKNLDFDRELPAGLGPGGATGRFVEANPRAEVPALIDGDTAVFDSTIILEYLEDKWPEPALLPREPAKRALARMVEDMCDTHYEAVNWGIAEIRWFGRAEGDLAERMLARAAEQTRTVQAWLASKLGQGPWFGGATFGWGDLSVAPYVNRSVHYGFGPDAGSPLADWLERVRLRPSVAETFAEFEAGAVMAAAGAQRLRAGNFRREYRDHRVEWMLKSGGLKIVTDGLEADNIRFSWP